MGEKNGQGKFRSLFYTYEGGWAHNKFEGDGHLVDFTKQIDVRSTFREHLMDG